MATYYWRGGSGTWNTSTTTNWSTSSGGSGGSGPPTSSDAAIFDANSGTGTCTLSGSPVCASLDASASTILTFTGTGTLDCAGNFTLKSGLTVSGWTGTVTLSGTGSQTTTFAGNRMAFSLTINGSGGTYTLQDDFIMATTNLLTVTQGDFEANGHNVTVGSLLSANSNTRTITQGSGTWILTGNGRAILDFSTTTNLTFNRGSAIVCNYSGATGTRILDARSMSEATCPSISVTAGTDTVNISNGSITASFNNVDMTGFTGTLAALIGNLYGNLTVPSGITTTGTTNALTFAATSGTKSIIVVPTMDQPFTFNGVGGTWQLAANLNSGATRTTTLTNGTLDLNGFSLVTGLFSSRSSSNARTLKGSGTIELTATSALNLFATDSNTNFTVTGAPNIKISGSTTSIRQFTAAANQTYGNLLITNATSGGQVNFQAGVTFSDFKQQDATPQTILFAAGTTTTVATWSAFGTAANLLTIGSITAAGHTLTKSGGGTISSDYLSISRSTATPGTTWYAGTHSTDGGNNSGWIFTAAFRASWTAGSNIQGSGMASLKKNVASQNVTFLLINSSTGAGLTGATVTVKVTKDNTQASGTGTVTELGGGQYNYAPTQAETNATDVGFLFTATSAIPVNCDFHTDLVNASGNVQVDAVAINAVSTSSVTTVSAFVGTTSANSARTGDAYGLIGVGGSGLTSLLPSVQRGVAFPNFAFVMTLVGAPVTGATVTATIRKDGGAFTACANAVTEVGNGWYSVNLTAGEMTANVVALRFSAVGCDDLDLTVPIGS